MGFVIIVISMILQALLAGKFRTFYTNQLSVERLAIPRGCENENAVEVSISELIPAALNPDAMKHRFLRDIDFLSFLTSGVSVAVLVSAHLATNTAEDWSLSTAVVVILVVVTCVGAFVIRFMGVAQHQKLSFLGAHLGSWVLLVMYAVLGLFALNQT